MSLIKFKNIMTKVDKINGWKCRTINKEIFKAAIISLDKINDEYLVKSTKNRTVFKLFYNKKLYYVKYSHPSSFSHKVKELLFSKSYSEFKSAHNLEKVCIPVIKMIGYAKKYGKSLLISEDAGTHKINAREYWLKTAKTNPELKIIFVNSLAEFIKKTINANVVHPDYHMGNLLIDEKTLQFMFIDPYGIKVSKKKKDIFKNGLVILIAFFKGDFPREEFSDFCIKSGIINNIEEFQDLWNSILLYQAKYLDKQWKNRRKRLLSKNSRFATTLVDECGDKWRIKKTLTGENYFNSNDLKLNLLKSKYRLLKTDSQSSVLNSWLFSFYLQFSSINHIRPLALNIDKNILILEKIDYQSCKYDNMKLDEFIHRCKMSGINIINQDETVAEFNNEFLLTDSNPAHYNLVNKFY